MSSPGWKQSAGVCRAAQCPFPAAGTAIQGNSMGLPSSSAEMGLWRSTGSMCSCPECALSRSHGEPAGSLRQCSLPGKQKGKTNSPW